MTSTEARHRPRCTECGVEVVCDWDVVGQHVPQHGGQGGHGAADRGLGHSRCLTDLGLDSVPAGVGQRDDHRFEQSQDRRPGRLLCSFGRGVHQGAQLDDLILGEACSMIHAGRPVSVN